MSSVKAPFTRAGVVTGIRMSLPALPGSILFASAFGAVAAQKGLSLFEATFMSSMVFAGISQMVTMEVWRTDWSLPALLTVAGVVAIVNMRMVLFSAASRPWFAGRSLGFAAIAHLPLTDVNYIVSTRARAEGNDDLGVLIGCGFFLWLVWIASTVPGYVAGVLIGQPERFGLDLIMPVYLVAMVTPLWKGHRQTLIWGAAGGVALAVSMLVPGYWFIMAGALTGVLLGALINE